MTTERAVTDAEDVAMAVRDLVDELVKVRIAIALVAAVQVENSTIPISAEQKYRRVSCLEELVKA